MATQTATTSQALDQLAKASPGQSLIIDLAQNTLGQQYEQTVTTPTKHKKPSKRVQIQEEEQDRQRRRLNPAIQAPTQSRLQPYEPNARLGGGKATEKAWYPAKPWKRDDLVRMMAAGGVPEVAVQLAKGRKPTIGTEPLRAPRWEPLAHIETKYGDEVKCRSLFQTVARLPQGNDYQWGGNPPRREHQPMTARTMAQMLQQHDNLTYEALLQFFPREQIQPIAAEFNLQVPPQ